MKQILSNLKKWNWTIFFVLLCVSYCGALSNKSFPDIETALIIGTIFGVLFGLILAFITKDED